jgi:hypothetical protein
MKPIVAPTKGVGDWQSRLVDPGKRGRLAMSLAFVGLSAVWPAEAARGQTRSWHTIRLNYGIRLEVPHDWTTDQPAVAPAIRAGQGVVDATALVADTGGHLIIFSGPSFDSNEVSLSIQIMPARLSQAALARMSDADIRAGDENVFRPDAEGMANRHGLRITLWNGTSRRTIGGRYGVVTSYRFKYPNGREVIKETYSVYLGSRSVNVHVFRRTNADARIVSALNRMIQSLVISVDSL